MLKKLYLPTSPQFNVTQILLLLSRSFSPKLLVSFVALTAIPGAPAAYCGKSNKEKEETIISGKRKSPEKTDEKQEKGKEKEEDTKRARINDEITQSSNQTTSLVDALQENGKKLTKMEGPPAIILLQTT